MEALEMVAVEGANIRKKDERRPVPAVMFPSIMYRAYAHGSLEIRTRNPDPRTFR